MENKIRSAREKAGLTQKGMSKALGIPLRTIEDWDRGTRKPPEWAENLILKELERMKDEG